MNTKRQGARGKGQGAEGQRIRGSKSQRVKESDKKNSELRTPNSKLIFILGGARSGKSAYALKLAESTPGKRLYLATAEALDDEMAERIKNHKKERGDNWATIEEPINIVDVIRENNPPSPMGTDLKSVPKGGQGGLSGKKYNVILLDCLTLWLSNLMHTANRPSPLAGEGKGGGRITKEIHSLISACKNSKANIIIVSNEVGMGIVPDNPLARQFRDIAGYANQKIATTADTVYFVAAGIPMRIK